VEVHGDGFGGGVGLGLAGDLHGDGGSGDDDFIAGIGGDSAGLEEDFEECGAIGAEVDDAGPDDGAGDEDAFAEEVDDLEDDLRVADEAVGVGGFKFAGGFGGGESADGDLADEGTADAAVCGDGDFGREAKLGMAWGEDGEFQGVAAADGILLFDAGGGLPAFEHFDHLVEALDLKADGFGRARALVDDVGDVVAEEWLVEVLIGAAAGQEQHKQDQSEPRHSDQLRLFVEMARRPADAPDKQKQRGNTRVPPPFISLQAAFPCLPALCIALRASDLRVRQSGLRGADGPLLAAFVKEAAAAEHVRVVVEDEDAAGSADTADEEHSAQAEAGEQLAMALGVRDGHGGDGGHHDREAAGLGAGNDIQGHVGAGRSDAKDVAAFADVGHLELTAQVGAGGGNLFLALGVEEGDIEAFLGSDAVGADHAARDCARGKLARLDGDGGLAVGRFGRGNRERTGDENGRQTNQQPTRETSHCTPSSGKQPQL